MKKFKLLALVVAMVTMLTACSSKVEENTALITGSIDLDIKSSLTNAYMEAAGMTADQCWAERDDVTLALVQIMQGSYSVTDMPAPSITNDLIPLYNEMLKQFEYTTSNPVENEDGSFTLTVTYKPFALGDVLDEIAYPFYDSMAEDPTIGDGDPNAALFELLVAAMEEFNKAPQLGEETSVDITVTFSEHFWELSDNFYDEFLVSVVDLNIEE